MLSVASDGTIETFKKEGRCGRLKTLAACSSNSDCAWKAASNQCRPQCNKIPHARCELYNDCKLGKRKCVSKFFRKEAAEPEPEPSYEKQMLDRHNAYRVNHGVSPLTWDDELAKTSSRWLREHACPKKQMYHSPSGTDFRPSGAGENLANFDEHVKAVDHWYGETFNWNWDRMRPNVADEGPVGETGHLLPIIWSGVQRVGCATEPESRCSFGTRYDSFGYRARGMTACQYSPYRGPITPNSVRQPADRMFMLDPSIKDHWVNVSAAPVPSNWVALRTQNS